MTRSSRPVLRQFSMNVARPLGPDCGVASCTTRAMASTPTWAARVRASPCMKEPAKSYSTWSFRNSSVVAKCRVTRKEPRSSS